MKIETNNYSLLPDFIRLNELWISEHFSLEDADRALAANPGQVIENGGFVFSQVSEGQVVGLCAVQYRHGALPVKPAGLAMTQHLYQHASTA